MSMHRIVIVSPAIATEVPVKLPEKLWSQRTLDLSGRVDLLVGRKQSLEHWSQSPLVVVKGAEPVSTPTRLTNCPDGISDSVCNHWSLTSSFHRPVVSESGTSYCLSEGLGDDELALDR